ncbi:protein disulfide oxidoreductase [Shewanella youngdeokensis]|uniref:Protein disulfide oxidoreductase n=1 Tax=Shewanella youngdeokensis TaxID=2999068 RepID=A0ABZ0JVS2_9GAMM|nr:protein disulfide oxidoreductase [Shewanella sp. DAU334]
MAENDSAQSIMRTLLKLAKQLVIMLLVFTLVSVAVDIWRSKDINTMDLPNIKALTIDGTQVDVIAMSYEQPVLVYFWGTWCPVCRLVSPAVDMMSQHYFVVTLAMRSGNKQTLSQYLQHKQLGFSVVNDPRGQYSRLWSVQVTPTIMIIKNGQLQYFTSGFTSLPGMWWRMWMA